MHAIKFKNNRLFYLDQTKLPRKEVWRECVTLKDAYGAIKMLRVRGAPLIGVFGAYALYCALKDFPEHNKERFFITFEKAKAYLAQSRPTAVNLFWALGRIKKAAYCTKDKGVTEIKKVMLKEAQRIHREDIELCRRIGMHGVRLIKENDRILTHCNTGFLATAGGGTALSIIYEAAKKYKHIRVYIDETRPLLQGARLTSWELLKKNLKATLICDAVASDLMRKGMIDKIIVGADRITKNGDVANKIGTYNIAVSARYHKVPFYIAAPHSTFDMALEKGKDIPIEERDPGEVTKVLGKVLIAPEHVSVYNPAFDVTPHTLVTAIITDRGIIRPPYRRNIKKVFSA